MKDHKWPWGYWDLWRPRLTSHGVIQTVLQRAALPDARHLIKEHVEVNQNDLKGGTFQQRDLVLYD